MISHTSVGSNDLPRASAFYEALGGYYGCYFRDLDGNKIAAFSAQK